MNMFKSRKQKFKISDGDPTYKVRYLGNVQTALMKGDGCVDKPTGVLWNNYIKNGTAGLEMQLTIAGSGLKAMTKEQGLTEYRAHRISYCIAHPKYPKLFVWVYRHEGKKMKVELRCHAVLCKTDSKAKAMAVLLHEKLQFALSEFMREKTRRQTTRLALQRTNSLPSNAGEIPSGTPARKKFLNVGRNFKPPIERSSSAPKLGDISEDKEGEFDNTVALKSRPNFLNEIVECEEEEENAFELEENSDTTSEPNTEGDEHEEMELVTNGFCDIEIGNDIEELRRDARVLHDMNQDSDEESTESGFSEQGDQNDVKESASASSTESASSAISDSSGTGSISSTGSSVTSVVSSKVVSANGHIDNHSNGHIPESIRL